MKPSPMLLALLALGGCSGEQSEQNVVARAPNDWLLAAESDEARFRLLQQQLRGFDQPMWEVGERFERLHEALKRENYPLAGYHWEKIRTAIENGVAKRPARRENAQDLFLEPLFEQTRSEFASQDAKRAWAAFERAKAACQACHRAEKVEYMNDQPVFDLARPAAGTVR